MKMIVKRAIFLQFLVLFGQGMFGQIFAPAVGQQGCTAYEKDSSAFIAWVSSCDVTRGWQDISTSSLGLASSGDASLVIGKADIAGVVSLGDGGSAICEFKNPITNGAGFDFAVFENSFNDNFLELAFVEVSSDGLNYFRFPSHSLSDTINQCGTFGFTDPTKINNLAGKYRGGYGTPFDLQELVGIAGLNTNRISHVKIIDVVGALDRQYAQWDAYKNKINDPWPTPFPSGGFDLDAIGVINQANVSGINKNWLENQFVIYPNPLDQSEILYLQTNIPDFDVELYNCTGQSVLKTRSKEINTTMLQKGVYFLTLRSDNVECGRKVLIK